MAGTKEKVSNNIPHDLVFNILSKLPIKSLKRFCCVTKSWADLIENPHFMTMYLCKDDENDDNSSLIWNIVPRPYTSNRDNLFMLSGERFENKVKLDWPPPFQDDDEIDCICKLVSVINGILCYYQLEGFYPKIAKKVVLWNPTTDEFKVIPPGSVDCPLCFDFMVDLNGFGYDPLTNDYKIIRQVSYVKNFRHVCRQYMLEPSWQIYSLKSNSWKNLDVEMPYKSCDEVYLNGMCHWLGVENEIVLVSFNLSDEVCHKTPLLYFNDYYDYRSKTMVALNNSIAMITMHAGNTCFDISILGEIGVRESWTRIITIGPLPCVADPIAVWNKGNMFFWKNKDELAMFNVSTQVVEEIVVKDQYSHRQIVIFKESLLPIGGIN